MEENKKPQKSLTILYAEAKADFTAAIREVMQKYQMPMFLVESLLNRTLAEIRSEVNMELAMESREYQAKVDEWAEKDREQLVSEFENRTEKKEEAE